MEKVKKELADVLISFIKGAKIFVIYMLPAALIATVLSPEFREWVKIHPNLASYAPLVNIFLIAIADQYKRRLPDSGLTKIL